MGGVRPCQSYYKAFYQTFLRDRKYSVHGRCSVFCGISERVLRNTNKNTKVDVFLFYLKRAWARLSVDLVLSDVLANTFQIPLKIKSNTESTLYFPPQAEPETSKRTFSPPRDSRNGHLYSKNFKRTDRGNGNKVLFLIVSANFAGGGEDIV